MDDNRQSPTKHTPRGDSFSSGGDFVISRARVVGFMGAHQVHLVAPMQGGGLLAAVSLMGGSGPAGARSSSTYPVGSIVAIAALLRSGEIDDVAYILGAVPDQIVDDSDQDCDYDGIGHKAGYPHDDVHRDLAEANRLRGFWDGTPLDSVGGDQGLYSPMGPASHVSQFMAYMRANDRTGLWLFALQELARLSAPNLEISSYGEEMLSSLDEAELRMVKSTALYPWEALGAFDQSVSLAEQVDDANPASADAEPYVVKPIEEDQRGVYRHREVGGYLGDVQKVFVMVPMDKEGVDSFSKEPRFAGVFRESISSNGQYLLQSAKGICLEKYSAIPYPTELVRPDDPAGDKAFPVGDLPADYKSSGVVGEAGDEHVIQDFGYVSKEETPAILGSLSLELHGFLARQVDESLRRHEKDWDYPSEQEAPLLDGKPPIDTSAIKADPRRMWARLPAYVEVDVDHRYKKSRYYQTRSAVDMLEDGSVVISDGYGSQIIMSGGNIIQSCAGDTIRAPGRNDVGLAGNDAISRAYGSQDISAGHGDVRVKAEVNMVLLQNNESKGGILVETRSTEREYDYQPGGEEINIAGLVLMARDGQITSFSTDLNLGTTQEGRMVIQTGGELTVLSNSMRFDVERSWRVTVGDTSDGRTGAEVVSYEITPNTVWLGAGSETSPNPVFVLRGSIQAAGSAEFQGQVNVKEGILAGGAVVTLGGFAAPEPGVGKLPETQQNLLDRGLEQSETDLEQALVEYAAQVEEQRTEFSEKLTEEGSYLFVDAVYENARGGMRTEKNYRTDSDDGFLLPQFLWQQIAEHNGGATKTWSEPVVLAVGDVETAPYPGVAPWQSKGSIVTVEDWKYFDLANGAIWPEDFEQIESARRVPMDHYLINTDR